MTTTFDTAFQSAQDRLDEVFGTSAIYNGTEVTVRIDGYDTAIEQYPEVWIAAATIRVWRSEVASPAVGDTVVMDGVTYQVGEILRRDTLSSRLALTRQMVRI